MDECMHQYTAYWYRITWSGNFKLISETCDHCGHVRERSIRVNEPSSYPSKEWIRIEK